MRFVWAALFAVTAPAVLLASFSQQPSSTPTAEACTRIASRAWPHTTITMAAVVPAGGLLDADASPAAIRALGSLPAFCRVAATLAPSADSDIKIEVWLPAQTWNGKLQSVGNGAFNGLLATTQMSTALAGGYATASTDTGHVGNTASFGLGHPEKVVDFGWRAVHEMTVAAKQIVAAYYGTGPQFSYWNGCSAGGRQAMQEAQRFPADYDGIIAGAPGLDWTGRAAQANHVAQALQGNEAARIPAAKRELLHTAVLSACDRRDQVQDGVIENPEQCTFDPGVLQCRGADEPTCLTSAQVATARMIYASRSNPQSRRAIAGLARGSERGWTDLGWTASARATGLDQFRYLVFQNPTWTIDRFSFDADIVHADEADQNTLNALNPDLSAFIARGGKLIQYHGWADPQISPGNSVEYYRQVLDRLGGASKVGQSYRLFMAPGMGHCGGGDGPNSFDMLTALEQWVERRSAPDRIIASRIENGKPVRTRPLCPYPQIARYTGKGSTDEAANFLCAAP